MSASLPMPDLSAFMINQQDERAVLENMEKGGGMVAIPIGVEFPPTLQLAFNKACETGYFRTVNIRMIDVPVQQVGGGPPITTKAPAMFYMMTPTGTARLRELRERAQITARLGDAQ